MTGREALFAAQYAVDGNAAAAAKVAYPEFAAPDMKGMALTRDVEVQEEVARIRGEMQARIQRDIPAVYAGLMDMARNSENQKIRYLCSKEIMQVGGYHSETPKQLTVNIQINGYLPPGVEGSLREARGVEVIDSPPGA